MADKLMRLKCSHVLPHQGVERILVRGTNWIGDAVMSLASISAIRKTYPDSRISVLAKPWVADIYNFCHDVDETILFERPGLHDGIPGILRLAKELGRRDFNVAILLQNAIEAAVISALARIPIRAGYNSDARGFLLTHAVKRTRAVRAVHQMNYYVEMVKALGCEEPEPGPYLHLADKDRLEADRIIADYGIDKKRLIVGIAAGATYGPAKKWLPDRFASLADRLQDEFSAQIILFGGSGDSQTAALFKSYAKHPVLDIVGKTDLRTALSLISMCSIFVSNDSGLMHVAGALNVPTLAVFGSTNPQTTSPVGDRISVIYKCVDCSPCLKESCPTDFRCMNLITTDEVYEAAKGLLCVS